MTTTAVKKKQGGGKPTNGIVARRRELITTYILAGLSRTAIERQLAPQGVSIVKVRYLYDKIIGDMRAGEDELLASARIQAIERIRRDLVALRNPGQLRNKNGYPVFENVLDGKGKPIKSGGRNVKRPVPAPIDYAKIATHERLLASIEGTTQPLEVKVEADVVIKRSILAVVANLTHEEMAALADEDRRIEVRMLEATSSAGVRSGSGPKEETDP